MPDAPYGTKQVAELAGILYPVNGGRTNLALLRAHAELTSVEFLTPVNVVYQERGVDTFVV